MPCCGRKRSPARYSADYILLFGPLRSKNIFCELENDYMFRFVFKTNLKYFGNCSTYTSLWDDCLVNFANLQNFPLALCALNNES